MLIDRILAVIAHSGLSQTSFAKKIGSTQANLSRQLNGQKIGANVLESIAQNFPEINCTWLLTGNGSMYIEQTDSNDKRMDSLVDVIAMQQEVIKNLQEKIKQLQNK